MLSSLSGLKSFLGKIGRYGVVGIILNVIGVILFGVLVHSGLQANISLLCSSILLFPAAYHLNKRYVFQLQEDSSRSRVKFIATYFLILFLNLFLLEILLRVTNLEAVIAQISIFIFLVIMNFTVQSRWIFKPSEIDFRN